MLIFIITAAIAVILLEIYIGIRICNKKSKFPDIYVVWEIATGVVGGLFFALTVILGSGLLIENSSYNCSLARMRYEERVEELNNTYNTLITLNTSDNNLLRLEIVSYNKEVKEFKESIKQAQINLDNPWISWFVCKEYANFNANAVSYIR